VKRQIVLIVESASRRIMELSRLSRLPAALLAYWLAPPAWTVPALACAAASTGDCCPDGGSAPCSEDGSGIFSDAAVCCASVPAPAQATACSPIRVEYQKSILFGSPDFSLHPASTVAFAQCTRRSWLTGRIRKPPLGT
jgi:hypothetical protein